jgi:hypothetical protein
MSIQKLKNDVLFYYFDTPNKKEINNTHNILTSQNANSGLSRSNHEIVIFRREEIFKVLIHELIHYLDYDIKYDEDGDKILNYQLGIYKYPILVNETITEILAQFIHSIFISSFNDNPFKTFKSIYFMEHIYSWYQFCKVMTFFNISHFNYDIIIKQFNQSTNIYSYYILKTILLNDFFNIIINTPMFNKIIISHSCTSFSCKNLIDLINNNLNQINLKKINLYLNNIKCYDSSLRMTLFELSI